jgi:hypothetical protein
MVIDGETLGTIINKTGFKDDVESSLQIIGMLGKLIDDEKQRMQEKLTGVKKYTIDNKGNIDRKKYGV